MLAFLLWVALASVIAIVVFLATYAAVEARKESRRLAERFRRANDADGLLICKPGLGWVPADHRYTGR